MRLVPLGTYRAPDYPTQESLRQQPELLRAEPRRWGGNRAVLGALAGALALMNQSCTSSTNPSRAGLAGAKVILVPTEDETKAAQKQVVRPKSKPDWAPFPGRVLVPHSVVPEDQAKAAANQTATGQLPPKP